MVAIAPPPPWSARGNSGRVPWTNGRLSQYGNVERAEVSLRVRATRPPRPGVDVGEARRDLAAMNKDRRDLQYRLIVLTAALVVILAFGSWLVWTDSAIYQWLFRLYNDHDFMRAMVERWGIFAPLAFILIQALQVVIAPIPGDVTGLLGGFLFGQRLGFIYSSVGLTIGSLFAFWLGRRLGAPVVKRMTGPEVWQRLDFIVEAEGAILCFIIFLVPGLPK